ncbi:uncharacterized protein LOC122398783 isoform X2 [Colletes gigas]|uniref:uncharacterized protein LOC122398783 isoform X2 n=1 Tax=Colletes gigas TaxID=935657 RepID=UPI001C9A5585|nr:uncharacterized protein LOC122398783 isoform X2 [Colletes gigas]
MCFFNNINRSMSTKRARQEYNVQTPIRSKRTKSGHNIDMHSTIGKVSKNQRRSTRCNPLTNTKYVQKTHTQAPKKSPRNVSPSKKHSINSSKLLITPKKLSLRIKSPIKSQKSSFKNNSLQRKARLSDIRISTPEIYKFTPEKMNKSKRTSLLSMKQGLRSFSKSPKIMLKSPNSKLVSKKSPKSKVPGNQWIPRSNEKKLSELKKRQTTSTRNSNADKTKLAHAAVKNIDVATSMGLISMKDAFALKEPVVVLQRLPILCSSSLVGMYVKNLQNNSNDNVSLEELNSTANSSLEKSKSNITRHFKTRRGKKRNTESPSKLQKIITVSPLKASTPREKEQLCKMNDKHEVEYEQENDKGKNETYELTEPKTPNLRKKQQKKRSAVAANLNEKAAKKNIKVHFTSSKSLRSLKSSSSDTNPMYRLRKQKEQIKDPRKVAIRIKSKRNIGKSPVNVFHRRSQFVSNENISSAERFTPKHQSHNKSKRITNINAASSLPLNYSVKKSDPKYSAKKEVPNFTQIHKRLFAKSESIIDAKKRLKERHVALTSPRVKRSLKSEINSQDGNILRNK